MSRVLGESQRWREKATELPRLPRQRVAYGQDLGHIDSINLAPGIVGRGRVWSVTPASSSAKVLWSGQVPVEYGFYRVAEPSSDLDLGLETGPMAAGPDGAYVFTLGGGDIMEVRLEVVLDTEPPSAPEATATIEIDHDREGTITAWDGEATTPPARDVLGPGTWLLWVERLPLHDDEPGTDEEHDPAEWHILHACPADQAARTWAQSAPTRRRSDQAARAWIRAGDAYAAAQTRAESTRASSVVDYAVNLGPWPKVCFVSWDTQLLAESVDTIDLAIALPDDATVIELPGALAFRQRAQAEISFAVFPLGVPQANEHWERKLRRDLPDVREAYVLDEEMNPIEQVPTPAAHGPCSVYLYKGIPEKGLWAGERLDDEAAARLGMYNWSVGFTPIAP